MSRENRTWYFHPTAVGILRRSANMDISQLTLFFQVGNEVHCFWVEKNNRIFINLMPNDRQREFFPNTVSGRLWGFTHERATSPWGETYIVNEDIVWDVERQCPEDPNPYS